MRSCRGSIPAISARQIAVPTPVRTAGLPSPGHLGFSAVGRYAPPASPAKDRTGAPLRSEVVGSNSLFPAVAGESGSQCAPETSPGGSCTSRPYNPYRQGPAARSFSSSPGISFLSVSYTCPSLIQGFPKTETQYLRHPEKCTGLRAQEPISTPGTPHKFGGRALLNRVRSSSG